MTQSVVAIVHAKGTSERLPGKALLDLGGKPLIAWAISAAKRATLVTEVVIDSEDETILSVGESCGARRLKRHPTLATNRTDGDELAWWQASCFRDSKAIIQVVPTCPFTKPQTIDMAIEGLFSTDVNSVVAVRSESLYTWVDGHPSYYQDGKLPNSQDLPQTVFETTGLYAVKTRYVLRHRRRFDPSNCLCIDVSKIEAIDINTEEDLAFARIVARGAFI